MSQLDAQSTQLAGGGAVLGLEGDRDVRIVCANESGCPVDIANVAVVQANVVDDTVHFLGRHHLANGAFDHVAQASHLFNACSCFSSQVKNKLAAIRIRKKVLTKPGHEQECRQASHQEYRNKDIPP